MNFFNRPRKQNSNSIQSGVTSLQKPVSSQASSTNNEKSPNLVLLDSSDNEIFEPTHQLNSFSFKHHSSLSKHHSNLSQFPMANSLHPSAPQHAASREPCPDLNSSDLTADYPLLPSSTKATINNILLRSTTLQSRKLSTALDELSPTFTRDELINNEDGAAFVHSTRPRARARVWKHSDLDTLSPSSEQKSISRSQLNERWTRLLASGATSQILKVDPSTYDELSFLLKQGIPSEMRARIWMQLSGAYDERRKHRRDYYQTLCELALKHQSVAVDDIAKDISRTLPAEPLFSKGDGKIKLTRLLTCWAIRKKEVGYAQGINQIAGCLLTILDEESAFWMFSQMIEQRIGYYC